jgi:heme O synthase-like polyprenyltransferase
MPWDSCLENVGGGQKVATLSCIPIVFANLINVALIFAGVVAVIFIILGGIKFINSGGDPKRVEGAQKTITFAILGLVIVFSSFLIIHFIGNVTGAKCITQFGFNNC